MPLDRNAELQRLCEADRHVAEAERAVTAQMIELERERLRHQHKNTSQAAKMLQSFENNLETMREHRKIIIKMIEQIDSGLA